jgi:hypothetical protein
MDDVVETLMEACGKLGVRPSTPFGTVFDFQAHVLEVFHPTREEDKEHALQLILHAVRQAEGRKRAGAVEYLKQLRDLSKAG